MSILPNTTTKGAKRRWPLYVLALVALIALALGVEAFLRAESFSPGKEIFSPGIQDIAASTENNLYPPPDTSRFGTRPKTIFVYLSVEDLPSGEDMEAHVERIASGSVFSLLFGGDGLEVRDKQKDQLRKDENGASGVVKFALKTKSGEPLPPGNYTVNIYSPKDVSGEGGTVAARKSFVIEE